MHNENGIESSATLEAMPTQGITSRDTPPPSPTVTASPAPTLFPPTLTPTKTTHCDWVSCVKDITIPDATVWIQGTTLAKTWQLKNRGTCSWTPNYALVFVKGALMGAPTVVSLPGNVNPGGTIVENNAHYLIPGDRELSGSEYGASDAPFTQKQEEIVLQIDPADLPAFVAAIQSGIDESIIKNDASIVGRGSGGLTGTSFSVQYREDQTYGAIDVWGVRGEGTNFFLIVLITES